MKKLIVFLGLALTAFGVDAANDLILSQRKADNSGSIQRNVAPVVNGLMVFNASKIPASPSNLTFVSGTGQLTATSFALGATTPGVISGASGAITITPGAASGLSIVTPSAYSTMLGGLTTGSLYGRLAVLASGSTDTAPLTSTYQFGTGSALEIFSDTTTGIHWAAAGATANVRPVMEIRRTRGTLSAPTGVVSGDQIFNLFMKGWDGTSTFFGGATIAANVDSAVSNGVVPGNLTISTADITGTSVTAAKWRSWGGLETATTSSSAPAWGTAGVNFNGLARQVTDTTSATGTVSSAVFNSFTASTINATNASVVYTNLANVFISGDAVTAGNATATNKWGLWNQGKLFNVGAVRLGSASGTVLTDTSGVFTLVGGAGNMTITSGTGNSRTLTLQTTTSGGTATNAVVFGATQAATFNGPIIRKVSALTYASPTAVDVTLGNVYTVTTVNATGSVTFNASGTGTSGQGMIIIITNDATSAKTITFGTNFTANGTLTASGVNKKTTIQFMSDGAAFVEVSRTVLP